MPTEDRIVEVDLGLGLDQKVDTLLRQGLSTARNCVFSSTGAIDKRNGMAALSAASAIVGGGTAPAATWTGPMADELVRLAPGSLCTYSVVGSAEWVQRGGETVPGYVAPRTPVSGGDGAVWATDTAVYSSGSTNLSCTAYVVSQADSTGALEFVTYVDVIQTNTKAHLLSRQKVASKTTAPNKVRVIAGIGRFHILYNTAGTVTCKSIQFATPTTLSSAGLSVTVASPYTAWDAHSYSSNVFVAYETTGSATPIRLAICTSSVDGLATTTATHTSTYAATGMSCLGVYSLNNAQVLVSSARINAGNIDVYVHNSTVAGGFSGSALAWSTASSSIPVTCDVISNTTTTSCTVFVSMVATAASPSSQDCVWWGEVNPASGATAYTNPRALNGCRAITKPLPNSALSTHPMLGVVGVHGSGSGFFAVMANWALASPASLNPYLVASWAPGQASHDTAYARTTVSVSGGGSVVTVAPVAGQTGGGGTVAISVSSPTVVPCVVKPTTLTAGTGGTAEYVNLTTSVPMAVDMGDELLIASGQPSIYDGERVFEAGFAWSPDTTRMGFTASNGAGSLENSGAYSYKFAYEYTDARGRRHIGPDSEATALTLGASDDTVTITIPTLTVTNRETWASLTVAPARQVTIGVYRTTDGGTIHHRVGGVLNNARTDRVTFEDRMSDATAETMAPLYTESGALSNILPPSAQHVAIHQGAAVLSNTDDGSLWYSKAFIAGEGVAFSAELTDMPPDGGCIATASLEERLILLGETRLFLKEGQMPNDQGQPPLSPAREIASGVGLLDARSLGSGPGGLYFQAQDYNVWCLTRGLQAEPVGMPATGVVATPTQRRLCSALNYGAKNQMLFHVLDGDGNGSDWITLDTYHSRAGRPVWSSGGFTDPISSVAGLKAKCACMWGGLPVVATGHTNSPVFREDTTQCLDTGGGNTRWVTMEVLTGEMRVGALQGYQRCKRVGVLAKKVSNHGVTVAVTTDDTTTQTESWTYTEINALTYERLRVHVAAQKGQSVRVYVADSDPGAGNRGTGQGLSLKGLAFLIGFKKGLRKTAAVAQR